MSAEPPVPPASAARDPARWFHDEIHAHDSQLKAYLRGSFPAVRDVEDVVQESYLRIWRARASRPIESAKAFLFRVARNVAVDLLRRGRSSPIEPHGEVSDVPALDEVRGAADQPTTEERIELLVTALERLPKRSREIVILCKLQGVSYRQAAERLGISEKTVAEHVYRGTQRLGEELQHLGRGYLER